MGSLTINDHGELLGAVSPHPVCAEKPPSRATSILEIGCIVTAFIIPIKLSLTYILLIPLIVLWIASCGPQNITRMIATKIAPSVRRKVLVPLGFFLLVILTHMLLGIDPAQSVRPYLSLCFFSLTLLLFLFYSRGRVVLIALLSGQAFAALHSCIENMTSNTFHLFGARNLFIGKVTESGQLSLSCLIACGIIWTALKEDRSQRDSSSKEWSRAILISACTTLCLTTLAFNTELSLPTSLNYFLGSCIGLLAVLAWRESRRVSAQETRVGLLTLTLCLPLLFSALLVNLKRGPLLGVIVGLFIFFLHAAPRISRWVLVSSAGLIAVIEPIRERIMVSLDHFFIEGGRSTIWRIGTELTTKLPTGLGYHNSETLRQFAPEIPSQLKHFHSNFLNIVAENGWLGLAIFIWFIVSVISLCFRDKDNYVNVGIGCAIISWQVAGLVEYNFGDSEVLLLVWVMLGSAFTLRSLPPESVAVSKVTMSA